MRFELTTQVNVFNGELNRRWEIFRGDSEEWLGCIMNVVEYHDGSPRWRITIWEEPAHQARVVYAMSLKQAMDWTRDFLRGD